LRVTSPPGTIGVKARPEEKGRLRREVQMATIDYGNEKLWEAVHKLALGAGRMKERLEAATAHIAMASGARRTMSPALRAKFDKIWARLTAVAAPGDGGSVRATIAQMSEEEACKIASEILDLVYKAKGASLSERKSRLAARPRKR
jgi:hypothetical protein